MNSERKDWHRLIKQWCSRTTKPNRGLTIPFLIGASEKYDINLLLREISQTELEDRVVLQECPDLKEYILSTSPVPASMEHYDKIDNLYINDDYLFKLGSLEAIINTMETLYTTTCEVGKYSKRSYPNIWEPFTEEDKAFIRAVFPERL
tara:strand:+ start:467 stop:913 length:447 start_codon:yes stop_codon:yes gene_type:complete